MSDNLVTPVRMLALESAVQGVRDMFADYATLERPYAVPLMNCLALGAPGSAPVATTASGAVTENRQYANSFFSTETGRETTISSPVNSTMSAAQSIVQGPRSTDPAMDYVILYTRHIGATDLMWRLVAQIANPSSGTWTVTDNSYYTAYLSNETPMTSTRMVTAVLRTGTRFRKMQVYPTDDYDAHATNYWILGLDLYRQGQDRPYYTIRQDTTAVGIRARVPYNLPFWRQRQSGAFTQDLDIPMDVGDQVYFYWRGVGSVTPLPPLAAMVDMTREVP